MTADEFDHVESCDGSCDDSCRGTKLTAESEIEDAEKRYPGPNEFVHLHVHTLFSTLDGVASPADYIGRAKDLGMQAIACTDHGSLAGLPDMYVEAKKAGIKLIPGVEAYLNEYHTAWCELKEAGIKLGEVKAKDPELADRIVRNRHLIVLAKNAEGFRNLLHITSESWKEGFYRKPRIWIDKMQSRKNGLVVLSGCINGPVAYEISRAVTARRAGENEAAGVFLQRAIDWIVRLKEEFGENFFLEVQMPGEDIENGHEVLELSLLLAKKYGVQTALTGDSHYLTKSDWETQRLMMAIEQKKTVDDPTLFIADTCEGYLKSRAEFRQSYHEQGYRRFASIGDFEDSCDGTIRVAEMCDNWKPDLSPKLPQIEDADRKLAELVVAGLHARGLHTSYKKYLVDGREVTHFEQAQLELQRIREKGFSSYFLITQDLVDFSRRSGWPVGPGRGSAPGSLVCYLVGITGIDPLKHGLSFNRFLSPSRGGYMLKCTMD